MKLIAGLGNPGKKYCNNRHNIGFQVVDELARRNNISLRRRLFSRANEGSFYIGDERIVLIQPL
ncbi:MAG: aminoacyl-tRNA hydrolase, partial [Candidatus Omnitrophota bacterium]